MKYVFIVLEFSLVFFAVCNDGPFNRAWAQQKNNQKMRVVILALMVEEANNIFAMIFFSFQQAHTVSAQIRAMFWNPQPVQLV